MFVRFVNDTLIGATVHLAGNVHDCDDALCKQLVADGKAVEVDPPVRPGGEHPIHQEERLAQHERLKEAEVIESGAAVGPGQARQATAMRQQWRSDSLTARTTEPERFKDMEAGVEGLTDSGQGIQTGIVVNPIDRPEAKAKAKPEVKHEVKHEPKPK